MGALNILLGTICWIILGIVLFIPVLLLLLYKYTIILFAKIFRPDLHPLQSNDSMVALDSSDKKPMANFGFLIKCKGSIKVEAMRARFSTCLLTPRDEINPSLPKYENLYSYLVTYGGFIFRKCVEEIKIEQHIYEKTLGQNETLEDLAVSWIMAKHIQDSPNWELILVPLTSTDETAVCFKIHHAFVDGYSLLCIIDKITGVKSPYLVKPFDDSIFTEIRQTLEAPCHLKNMKGDPERDPFKVPKQETPQWMCTFITLDLDLIKQIRRKQNVHFATLMLALIAGVLRRYLLESKKESDIVPVVAGSTLPWPNHPVRSPNVTLCNHWVVGIVKLPLDIEDSLERLKKIEDSFAGFQNLGLNKFTKRFILPLVGLLPACALRAMSSGNMGMPVGLTSIVGGNDYKMIARKISIIQPLIAIQDINSFLSLSCFTFSHSNSLDVTISANPHCFSDRQVLKRIFDEYLQEELQNLCTISGINEPTSKTD